MSFYLKPPRGDIHMEKILDLCRLRCIFLNLLNNYDGSEDFFEFISQHHGYLYEGVAERSSKDRISHFMTRLSVSFDYDLSRTFVNLETKLFQLRLTYLDTNEKLFALNEVERHLSERYSCSLSLMDDLLAKSVRHVIDYKMLTHPCLDESSSDFGECCCRLKVPFELVLDLVSKRKVEISQGLAAITCRQVNLFLSSVFKNVLLASVHDSKNFLACKTYGQDEDDNRLENILRQIRQVFCEAVRNGEQGGSIGPVMKLTAEMVEEKQEHFPPCFRQLHKTLVKQRRLHHHSRIAYSMFLKEIGLSRDNSVKFWQMHYAQPSLHSRCSHTWQANEKKFLYSIDHLFGRAGGRKQYSAHGCCSILRRDTSPNEQLTCPFAVSDDKILFEVLEDYIERGLSEKVFQFRKDPQKACSMLLFFKTGIEVKEMSKPSKFFNLSVSN